MEKIVFIMLQYVIFISPFAFTYHILISINPSKIHYIKLCSIYTEIYSIYKNVRHTNASHLKITLELI